MTLRAENRAGDPGAGTDSLLALHGALPLRSRTWLLLARRGEVWQSRGFLHLERCARRLWPTAGSPTSKRCGACWIRPNKSKCWNWGPDAACFAHDVLDWSEKKFPDFFRAVHYTLVERSPSLRQTSKARLSQHLSSGRASIADTDGIRPGSVERLPSEVPIIVVANEFFDALPVEVLSAEGSLRIDVRRRPFRREVGPGIRRRTRHSSTATAFIPGAASAPRFAFSAHTDGCACGSRSSAGS